MPAGVCSKGGVMVIVPAGAGMAMRWLGRRHWRVGFRRAPVWRCGGLAGSGGALDSGWRRYGDAMVGPAAAVR